MREVVGEGRLYVLPSLTEQRKLMCILNTTVCAGSIKVQPYISEQEESKVYQSGCDLSRHFTAPLLLAIHFQPNTILNAQGEHRCFVRKSKLLNNLLQEQNLTSTAPARWETRQVITPAFTSNPNLTCHANSTGGKTKPRNLPALSLPLNYQTICTFKELLASTAQHLHPIRI